ncbi:MAG TPA: aminoglycoside phosphotransferase family protein [Limnochordia bacterium]|nr:aminoglycoside phosphotransferase family protein [Limnochordia bacterium]
MADHAALAAQVETAFGPQAARFGLDQKRISARYVLNWGGFVNPSFTLSDGARRLHLKLVRGEEDRSALRRWHHLAAHLRLHYGAPQVLGWFELPDSEWGGLLFEHVDGRNATAAELPQLLPELLGRVARLHHDATLRAQLSPVDGDPPSCAEALIETYVERFRADLAEAILPQPPAFVTDETLAWMQAETGRLEALARAGTAQSAAAVWPTHGDLHLNNVLVRTDGGLALIDWDDLAMGDPALEYAILLWPLLRDAPERWRAFALPAEPGFAERLELALRAHLLDEVIDTLADYVEADAAPEHAERVRAAKRQTHESALALYRRRYPSRGI